MNMTATEIWGIILLMGIGTFLIRFSFLGLIGNRDMPPIVLRLLRYTPVAVLPAMVAPLVVWPAVNDGMTDPVRLTAACVALGVGLWRKNVLAAIGAGAITLALGLVLTSY